MVVGLLRANDFSESGKELRLWHLSAAQIFSITGMALLKHYALDYAGGELFNSPRYDVDSSVTLRISLGVSP